MKDHNCRDSFSPLRVRTADHRAGSHSRMLHQDTLHFRVVNIEAATDDQILGAPAQGKVTVR